MAVTRNPSAVWTAAQVTLAYPEQGKRPAYLIHDRQRRFTSLLFRWHLEQLGFEDKRTAPTHRALDRDASLPRAPASAPADELVVTPVLGGLHHTYRRSA